MRDVENDPKVCDKDEEGNVAAKNQKGSTLAEIMDADDE